MTILSWKTNDTFANPKHPSIWLGTCHPTPTYKYCFIRSWILMFRLLSAGSSEFQLSYSNWPSLDLYLQILLFMYEIFQCQSCISNLSLQLSFQALLLVLSLAHPKTALNMSDLETSSEFQSTYSIWLFLSWNLRNFRNVYSQKNITSLLPKHPDFLWLTFCSGTSNKTSFDLNSKLPFHRCITQT